METLRPKAKVQIAIALAASILLLTVGLVARNRPAGADPGFVTNYVGVGSDTLQDLFNSYSGAEPAAGTSAAKLTTRLTSSQATGLKGISSWDAFPGNLCISTKLGSPSYDRPNGSGDGIAALSNAFNSPAPTNWLGKGNCAVPAGVTSNVQGQIDFARSSRGPGNTTTSALTYIPFARDAVTYAYFDHGTGNAQHLTTADLNNLYVNGPQHLADAGGDLVIPCLTQDGSGTTKFFIGAIGVTASQANAASAVAAPGGCGTANPSTLEENGGNTFFGLTAGSAAGTDYVVDFSVGSWISQANGVAVDRSSTARGGGVDLGNIDTIVPNPPTDSGKPYNGVAGSETPNLTFYASTKYGRNLFVVVPTSKIGTFGDSGLKSLFVGAGSSICAATAQTAANAFGFASFTGVLSGLGTCGATTLTGSLFS